MTTKKVAPKPKKKKVAPKPTEQTTMESYSIRMVIPTAQYANIQPEIVVKSSSPEEAHKFISPHMNKLWKEYYLVNERRPEPAPAPKYVPKPEYVNPNLNPGVTSSATPMSVDEIATATGGTVIGKMPEHTAPAVEPPDSGVALIKATQAIESCLSLDALTLIQEQVIKSVKLSEADKESLMPLLEKKSNELFEKDEK